MSLSTNSSTGSSYAAMNAGGAGGGGVLKAIEAVPGKIVDGVADVGEAVGEVASATVSFSERAMAALAAGGLGVVHGVEDAIAFPFEMVGEAAVGVEHAVEGGIHLLASGVSAAIGGVEAAAHGAAAAVHAVTIDLPAAIAADVADVTHAVAGDAATLAGAAAGFALLTGTSPVKLIGSMF